MSTKQQCYFLYGEDTYRLFRARKAIEAKFLRQSNSMADLVVFDMAETSLDALKQSLNAIPFLVSHRLFILKNCFQTTKIIQEALPNLLAHLADTTIVVLFEPTQPDKRTGLFKWLQSQARVEVFPLPNESDVKKNIVSSVSEYNVTITPDASDLLVRGYKNDTWQLALEIKKLTNYVLSQERKTIDDADVTILCHIGAEATAFGVSDALRDGKLDRALRETRSIIEHDDPLLVAGSIAAQVRAWTKLTLALKTGARPSDLAKVTQLNPYVVKLNLTYVQKLKLGQLKESYRELVRFDRSVKHGEVDSNLGLSLLLFRIHRILGQQ